MADDLRLVLDNVPVGQAHDAWDIYHGAANPDEFKSRLDKVNLPNSVKADLWDLKYTPGFQLKPSVATRPGMPSAVPPALQGPPGPGLAERALSGALAVDQFGRRIGQEAMGFSQELGRITPFAGGYRAHPTDPVAASMQGVGDLGKGMSELGHTLATDIHNVVHPGEQPELTTAKQVAKHIPQAAGINADAITAAAQAGQYGKAYADVALPLAMLGGVGGEVMTSSGRLARLNEALKEKPGAQIRQEAQSLPSQSPSGTGETPSSQQHLTAPGPKEVAPGIGPPKPEGEIPGPGAMNVTQTPSQGALADLTESIRGKKISPPPQSPIAHEAAAQVSSQIRAMTGTATSVWDTASEWTGQLWNKFWNPEAWTNFKDSVGKFQGDLQYSAWKSQDWANEIKKAIPDKVRREAITNYIQADGDRDVLASRAAASNPKLRPGYEAATTLTPDEITFANNIRNHFDDRLAEAMRLGMLDHGIENYINQVWEKGPNAAADKLRAASNFNSLKPNAGFMRKRIFDSYFEGEQKGFVPKDKDIGALIANYNQAFDTALASRAFIKHLQEGVAADGRPLTEVSGVGKPLDPPVTTDGPGAYFIRPKAKGSEDVADYRFIDHPALRAWKWVTKDAEDKPVFMQGDMLVHPEAFRDLSNILGQSFYRKYPATRALLKFSTEAKNTMLAFAGFHQVQIAVHSLEHTINPLRPAKLNLDDPLQRALVDHGLMVAEYPGMQAFSEGLHGSGILNRTPLVGKYLQGYQDYLFREYIPQVKMKMAMAALERNKMLYSGKLSEDQLLALTAKESNAAFGHLNYKLLARNPSLQDTFRLLALAPDFLEARARFVGQAIKPYGREQLRALALGTVGLIGGKYILGQMTGQPQDWSNSHLLYFKYNDKEYSLRTIQGDLVHLGTQPTSFFMNRLNPALTRPFLERITGRDMWGRRRTGLQELQDFYKGVSPIPLRPLVDSNSPQTLTDALVQSVGLQSRKYKSNLEQYVFENTYYSDAPQTPESQQRTKLRSQLRSGKISPQDVMNELGPGEGSKLLKSAQVSPLERSFRALPLEKALKGWNMASPQEKTQLAPILLKKYSEISKMKPEKQGPMIDALNQALSQVPK